jgi:hypothetical protein
MPPDPAMPPDLDEYCRVRDKLRQIFEDYVRLYSMRGVQYKIDLYRDASELDQRAKEALENAKYLDGLLERMYTLAATDPLALGDEWSGILEVLECYTYHHQVLKGVRPLAKLWRRDIPTGRGGRPRGPALDESWFRREYPVIYLDLLRRDGQRPSQLKVASELGLNEKTFRNYRKAFNLSYPPM